MHRLHRYLLFLSLLATLSSNKLLGNSIELHEVVHVHDNGSGQFSIAVDLIKAEQLIKVVSLLAQTTPDISKECVQSVLSKLADSLKHVSGIRKVAATHNDEMLHFKLSFHFSSIKALNRAMRKLYTHVDHPGCTYFKMNHCSFERVDTKNMAELLSHYYAQADSQIIKLIPKTLLNAVTYNVSYRFDRKIEGTTQPLANITEDGCTLLLQQSLFDACEKELSLSQRIMF